MPAELAARGRVYAAEVDDDQNLRFCVKIDPSGPSRCLELDFASHHFESIGDMYPSLMFAQAPFPPDSSAGAMLAANRGTVRVCGDEKHCVTVRVHAPMRGARDEVYGALPAVAVPHSSRVLVARTKESFTKSRTRLALYVDAVDLKRRARVASAFVARGESAVAMYWLGAKALLEVCAQHEDEREDHACAALAVNPRTLATKKLAFKLPRDEDESARAHAFLQWTRAGRLVVVNRAGTTATWVGPDGRVTRKVQLAPDASASATPTRVGRRNQRELLVLRGAPAAGNVVLVNLENGNFTRFDAPACPRP